MAHRLLCCPLCISRLSVLSGRPRAAARQLLCSSTAAGRGGGCSSLGDRNSLSILQRGLSSSVPSGAGKRKQSRPGERHSPRLTLVHALLPARCPQAAEQSQGRAGGQKSCTGKGHSGCVGTNPECWHLLCRWIHSAHFQVTILTSSLFCPHPGQLPDAVPQQPVCSVQFLFQSFKLLPNVLP